VLISNTIMLGVLLLLFATIGIHTPVWSSCPGIFYGAFTSLQYTSNEYAGLRRHHRPADQRRQFDRSTMQQMSISFGVATAGLATAFFVPGTPRRTSRMIQESRGSVALGIVTIILRLSSTASSGVMEIP